MVGAEKFQTRTTAVGLTMKQTGLNRTDTETQRESNSVEPRASPDLGGVDNKQSRGSKCGLLSSLEVEYA